MWRKEFRLMMVYYYYYDLLFKKMNCWNLFHPQKSKRGVKKKTLKGKGGVPPPSGWHAPSVQLCLWLADLYWNMFISQQEVRPVMSVWSGFLVWHSAPYSLFYFWSLPPPGCNWPKCHVSDCTPPTGPSTSWGLIGRRWFLHCDSSVFIS